MLERYRLKKPGATPIKSWTASVKITTDRASAKKGWVATGANESNFNRTYNIDRGTSVSQLSQSFEASTRVPTHFQNIFSILFQYLI